MQSPNPPLRTRHTHPRLAQTGLIDCGHDSRDSNWDCYQPAPEEERVISFFSFFFLPSKVKPEVRPWTENECEATAIFPRQLVKHNINGQLLNHVLGATAQLLLWRSVTATVMLCF